MKAVDQVLDLHDRIETYLALPEPRNPLRDGVIFQAEDMRAVCELLLDLAHRGVWG